MVQVKALINYKDLILKRDVGANEVFEVTEERAKELTNGNSSSNYEPFVEIIAKAEQETKQEVEQEAEQEVEQETKQEVEQEAEQEVETADLKVEDFETADVKPIRRKRNTNK